MRNLINSNGQSRFTGPRIVAGALLLVALLGLAACNNDKKVEGNGGNTTQISNPHGTVTGQVEDTNGNPIADAQVFVAGMDPVTTNGGGQFRLKNVPVIGASSNGISGIVAGAVNGPINVQVVPPTGGPTQYLQATAIVTPAAQATSSDSGGGPASPPGSGGQTNPQEVFVDGFTASTGVIKLPALTTTVKGTLVDSTTGGPVAGADIDLDFVGTVNDNGTPSVAIQYAYNLVNMTTAGDGSFSFTGVPDDSCFFLLSPGLAVIGATGPNDTSGCAPPNPRAEGLLVSTQSETANSVVLGDVMSTSFATGDTTPPYVTKVAQVVDQTATPGALTSATDGTGGIDISFSEPLPGVPANPNVLVVDTTTNSTVPATASFAGGMLTVTTGSPLTPGDNIQVELLADQFTDAGNNALTAAGPGGGANPPEVAYDAVGVTDPRYVGLNLNVFNPPITGLTPVTNLVQKSDPTNADTSLGACANSVALFASSNAFLDTSPDTLSGFGCVIAQLNTEVLDAPPLGLFANNSVRTHLRQLEGALLGTFPGLGPVNILTELANLSFTTSGAVDYVIVVKDGNGQPVGIGPPNVVPLSVGGQPPATIGGAVALGPPYSDGMANGVELQTASGDSGTVVNFLLGPVQPGYTVAVVPRGTGGVVSSDVNSAATVALQDNGRPTVGVQIVAAALNAATAASSGSGGGPISSVTTAGGRVIYPVTPLAYDRNQTNTPGTYTGEDLNGADEPGGLSNPAIQGTLVPGPSNSIYDATGWAAFVPTNNLGVSVTEPFSTTATQPVPAYGGSAALSFVNTLNNVTSPANGSMDNDLYVLGVDNLDKLQADGRSNSQDIDLTGIVDASGLAADAGSNAKAQVRDVTPPFMTQAFRSADGQNLVFTFNEPVDPIATPLTGPGNQIRFEDCGGFPIDVNDAFDAGLNAPADIATLSNGGQTITIPSTNSTLAGFPGSICFAQASYAESVYGTQPGYNGTDAVAHGEVRWSVPDTADNSDVGLGDTTPDGGANDWSYWTGMFSGNLGEPAPVFAAADLLGPFLPMAVVRGNNYSTTAPGPGAAGTTFSIDITFTQPFFLTDGVAGNPRDDADGDDADELAIVAGCAGGAAGDDNGTLTPAEVLNWACTKFEYNDSTGPAVIMPTAVQILDSNGQDVTTVAGNNQRAKRIVLTFTQMNPIAAADRVNIIAGKTITSQFDMTNNSLIFPFDLGTGQPQGSVPAHNGNGINDPEELNSIPPAPAIYTP